MKLLPMALLCGCAGLLLASCQASPATIEAVRAGLQPLVEDGTITNGQLQSILDAMFTPGTDWLGALGRVGELAGTALLTYFGINLKRGDIMNRKGLAPPATN